MDSMGMDGFMSRAKFVEIGAIRGYHYGRMSPAVIDPTWGMDRWVMETWMEV